MQTAFFRSNNVKKWFGKAKFKKRERQMYKCLEPWAGAPHELNYQLRQTWFAAHASSRSSRGGYTRHERAAEIEPTKRSDTK